MAQTVSVIVNAENRARLAAVIGDRNRPQKHVQRARIVLLSAGRLPVAEIARLVGISRPSVWRWQRRFAESGVDVLLREPSRNPGKAPLPPSTVSKIVTLTCGAHWTGRAMAKAMGISLRTVQRILEAHHLQTHRIRTFKKSNVPAFAEKVEDIVGVYMNLPSHAVIVSIDEKSQIHALDRTQPGLPMKPGKCRTMTHDYKRNGTTTLFAALNILDGTAAMLTAHAMAQRRQGKLEIRRRPVGDVGPGVAGQPDLQIDHAPAPCPVTDRRAVMDLARIDRDDGTRPGLDHAAAAQRALRPGLDQSDAVFIMAVAREGPARRRDHAEEAGPAAGLGLEFGVGHHAVHYAGSAHRREPAERRSDLSFVHFVVQ